jgi:hypothetical protein
MLVLLHGYYEPDSHILTEIISMHASTFVHILYDERSLEWETKERRIGGMIIDKRQAKYPESTPVPLSPPQIPRGLP